MRVIRGENVSIGKLRWDSEKFWGESAEGLDDYLLKEGDIVIGMDGSRVGQNRAMIKKEDLPLILAQRVACLRAKEKFSQNFLWCIIFSDVFKNYVNVIHTGSSVPHISQAQIEDFEFPFPPLEEQKKIAGTLALIDRKIELCESQNRTLEKLARQIYDYWFVQFDFPDENGRPYKSSGGKMVYNEKLKREIPEGWEVKSVGEVADVKKGELITESIATEGRVKVVAAGIDYSYFHGVANREKNTITISASGANAGFIRLWLEPIFASDCTTVRGETDMDTFFLFSHLISLQGAIYRCFRDSGSSAQPHVYPNDIKSILTLSIPYELKVQVGFIFCDVYESIAVNQREIQTLTSLRERLLPLLMNGQVEVRD